MTTLNETRWAETSFVCYGCDAWAGDTLSSGGTQPWIWASNSAQVFEQATLDTKIKIHNRYGYFSLQMTGQDQDATSNAAIIPVIDFSLSADQEKQGEKGSSATAFRPGAWVQVHGSLLVLGIMILFPGGAVAIRTGSKKSFKTHLYLQVAASACCLVGAAVAMFSVGFNFSVGKDLLRDEKAQAIPIESLTTTIARLVCHVAHSGRHGAHAPNPAADFSGLYASYSL